MTRYALPDLPYDYAALEPHISGRIMELHHGRHHRTYVEHANRALEKLLEQRSRRQLDQVATLERELAFNISGHALHSIFWQNLSPAGGGSPDGQLATAIDADFGSFELFKEQVTRTAMTTMGSGWAALIWEPVAGRLAITQIHDHQSDTIQGAVPLLVLDAWEHAYYLQYNADKAKFFEAVWNVFNWDDVAERYRNARAIDAGLPSTIEASPH